MTATLGLTEDVMALAAEYRSVGLYVVLTPMPTDEFLVSWPREMWPWERIQARRPAVPPLTWWLNLSTNQPVASALVWAVEKGFIHEAGPTSGGMLLIVTPAGRTEAIFEIGPESAAAMELTLYVHLKARTAKAGSRHSVKQYGEV